MLKQLKKNTQEVVVGQPPSGGCVLKQNVDLPSRFKRMQPPSGGCVLKLVYFLLVYQFHESSHLRVAVC